jgi:Ca-activated chloride channel family protein
VRVLAGKQAVLRQILVITDGCSNVGVSPVDAAARAKQSRIVVNVIGVVDKGDLGQVGRDEAYSIADAGGGMCRIVEPADLSATVQMLTHQTMQLTLHEVVNQELLQVMGKSTEDLPPADRSKVMQVIDRLEDEVRLELVVAIDMSASMKDKLPTVREAVRDLVLSLQARQGEVRVAVIGFPGEKDELVRIVQPFAADVNLTALERQLVARGGTPTGPAIDYAIQLFDDADAGTRGPEDDADLPLRGSAGTGA